MEIIMKTIQEIISAPQYDFLRENDHFGSRLLFVTFSGSHAYGVPTEFSDVDIRGCTVGTKSDILGMSAFSQYSDKATNTVIYSFFRFISKIVSGDFHIMELLCCEPEQYAMVSTLGQKVIEAKDMFLSQRISVAYIGYIRALQEALDTAGTRLSIGRQVYEKGLLAQCENAVAKFNRTVPDGAKAYIRPSNQENRYIETVVDINVEGCPVRELNGLLTATSHIVDTMEKAASGRNYIDRYWISKKMFELVRALYTCSELLEASALKTFRKDEIDILKPIREGKYVLPNSTISPDFFDLVESLKKRLDYARENTSLPAELDMTKIDEFVMAINEQSLL